MSELERRIDVELSGAPVEGRMADGTVVKIRFAPDQRDPRPQAHKVVISGTGDMLEGQVKEIELRHIQILDQAPAGSLDSERFWSRPSADGLASEQGVLATISLDELAGEWPDDDSLDDFLEFVRQSRE